MDNESQEMYLKIIYELQEQREVVRTSDIASLLKIAPASVTEMLEKLAAMGLLNHKPYSHPTLTKKGQFLAKKIVRKHRLLEKLLHDYMGLPMEKANIEACRLEHALSDGLDQRICILMNRPLHFPGKSAIPHCIKRETCQKCLSSSRKAMVKSVMLNLNRNPGH